MANIAVESFVFYKSFYDSTKNLKDSDKLLVFNAIFSYTFEGKEIKLKGIPAIIWTLVKPNIDASINNRVNGRKGGRPKKSEETKRGVIKTKKGGLLESENPALQKTITNGDVNEDVNEDVDANENVDEDLPFPEELPKVPNPETEIPVELQAEDFLSNWENWKKYRKEIKKALKPSTEQMQLKRMAKEGVERSIEAIELTIEGGWIGLVWDRVKASNSSKPFDDEAFFNSFPKGDE